MERLKQFPRLKNFGDAYKEVYFLTDHLVDEGDFLISEPMETRAERQAFTQYVCWWANRHNKVIKVQTIWVPAEGDKPSGKAVKVTLVRKYRYFSPPSKKASVKK